MKGIFAMISSLVVTGTYNIGRNSSNKICVEDNIMSIDKDIPFVRYRFSEYNDNSFEYIKKSIEIFNRSTHLAEVNLDNNTVAIINKLRENNMAVFVFVDITDADIANGAFNPYVVGAAEALKTSGVHVDRFMIRDKTTSLDTVTAEKFIKQLMNMTGMQKKDFGICSSPLSFGNYACLTAVKARELMSQYSTPADVALPSANHQNMNTCGCIRYFVINNDLMAPSDGKAKRAAKKSSDGDGEAQRAPREQKHRIRPGIFNI